MTGDVPAFPALSSPHVWHMRSAISNQEDALKTSLDLLDNNILLRIQTVFNRERAFVYVSVSV